MNLNYFGQAVDPTRFYKGHGSTSLLIRFFDWLRRWSTEKLCLLILKAQLKKSSLNDTYKKKLYREAVEDPELDLRLALPTKVSVVRKADRKEVPFELISRSQRYVQGRINSDGKKELIPFELEEQEKPSIFEQFDLQDSRAARYIGRRGAGEGKLLEGEEFT